MWTMIGVGHVIYQLIKCSTSYRSSFTRMDAILNHTEHQERVGDSRPPFPLDIPGKFDVDGKVQRFPGNTIISHLSSSSELYASLMVLHEKLRQSHLSSVFTLLPPSSW